MLRTINVYCNYIIIIKSDEGDKKPILNKDELPE